MIYLYFMRLDRTPKIRYRNLDGPTRSDGYYLIYETSRSFKRSCFYTYKHDNDHIVENQLALFLGDII